MPVNEDTAVALAQDHTQYLAYLLQRAGGAEALQFEWVDDRWPSCRALRVHGSTVTLSPSLGWIAAMAALRAAMPDIPEQTWTRYLARISYCAAICLHPEEAIDAVLHAEVGATEGPEADAIRGHLERAVSVLASEGMMEPELSLRVVRR
jgi:hypothetical protein